jgi:hypothetical protein
MLTLILAISIIIIGIVELLGLSAIITLTAIYTISEIKPISLKILTSIFLVIFFSTSIYITIQDAVLSNGIIIQFFNDVYK